MKILITGADGQQGKALEKTKPEKNECIFCNKNQLDITNKKDCEEFILEIKPDWLINAAAFTNVDKAEELKELTYKVNSEGPTELCKILSGYGGRLLQFSTDFVFNGEKSYPYSINDKVNPINIYGMSKVNAEKNILNYSGHVILRSSWIYSDFGNNFLKTILRLQKNYFQNNEPLKVVLDQVGTPTSAYTLSKLCWLIVNSKRLDRSQTLIFHWSDSGVASWYDFAHAIGDLSLRHGLIDNLPKIEPILTKDLDSKALRPKYSVLNSFITREFFDLQSYHWRDELNNVLKKISSSIMN